MNSTTQLQRDQGTTITIRLESSQMMAELSSRTLVELKLTDNERSLRILHVDDDECFLQVTKQILEMDGKIEVETAVSVDEAIEHLKRSNYDLVVSDYEMPGKNGLQFLEELRKLAKNLPFILFTGKPKEELTGKTLNLGDFKYLNKNGDTETVYSELTFYIKQSLRHQDHTSPYQARPNSVPCNLWRSRVHRYLNAKIERSNMT